MEDRHTQGEKDASESFLHEAASWSLPLQTRLATPAMWLICEGPARTPVWILFGVSVHDAPASTAAHAGSGGISWEREKIWCPCNDVADAGLCFLDVFFDWDFSPAWLGG